MMSDSPKKSAQFKLSIQFKLIVGALFLLIIALAFNAMLSLNALEKLYVESIASQYSAIGKDLQRNLERSLRFGKNIEKFVGIDEILEDTKLNLTKEISGETNAETVFESTAAPNISVSVALPDGSILYSTDGQLIGITLPEEARWDYAGAADSALKLSYVKYNKTYITPLPIRDRKNTWIATAFITFDEKQVRTLLNTIRNQNVKLISLIIGGSFIVMILLFRFITPNTRRIEIEAHTFPKIRIYLTMFCVIGFAQILFSSLNIYSFRNYYLQINKEKTRALTMLLKEDIEFLFSKGININKLVKMDALMGEIIAASPELHDIAILDQNDSPLYLATKEGIIDFQKATEEQKQRVQDYKPVVDLEYNVRLDLVKGETVEGYISANIAKEGSISTNISKEVIFARLREIALDSVTILIISLLFFVELLILTFQVIERELAGDAGQKTVHYRAIRPAGFLFLFGTDISISFLPLYMEKLYEPMFGLSKDMIMGLPISVEMFFAGIAVFMAGVWIDRRGWHEPFISGLALAITGILYSWLAPNALHFILSRGVAGMGYGLALMATQGFVITYCDEGSKAQGLSQLFAGILAGSLCGGATGAMLAERIGYSPVFLVGACILSLTIGYMLIFMRHAIKKPEHHLREQPVPSVSIGQFFRFLFNRNIFTLLLFAIFPTAVAGVGFINYFFPIYLNRLGTSQSNIGRIYMIFCLCLIYVAPFVSKYVDTSENKKMYIVVNGILGGFAFITFYFIGGILATIIAILCLGISTSFDASRAYALKFKITQELGAGKAMGIFSSTEKLGQVLGPVVFGALFLAANIQNAITYFGLAYLAITILFLLFAKRDSKIV